MNNALAAFSRELLENTITAIAQKHGLDVSETLREFIPTDFTVESKTAEAKPVKEKKEKQGLMKAEMGRLMKGETKEGRKEIKKLIKEQKEQEAKEKREKAKAEAEAKKAEKKAKKIEAEAKKAEEELEKA